MNTRDALSVYDDQAWGDDPGGRTMDEPEKAPEEPMIPKSRFDEVNNALQMERQSYHQMVQGMLTQQQQMQQRVPRSEPIKDEPPEGLDEEAWKLMRPILDSVKRQAKDEATAEAYNAIVSQYGDALNFAKREAGVRELDARVPGFEQDLFEETKQLFNSLPAEDRARYDNPVGIEALAKEVKLRRLTGGVDLSGMAHSAPRGSAPTQSEGAKQIWNMSEEEFVRRFGE